MVVSLTLYGRWQCIKQQTAGCCDVRCSSTSLRSDGGQGSADQHLWIMLSACKVSNSSNSLQIDPSGLSGQGKRPSVSALLTGDCKLRPCLQVPARPSTAAPEKKSKGDKSSGGGIIAAIDAVGAGPPDLKT